MSVIEEVKSRLDILDIVSQYTQLQRSGRSFKALCPFHTEKTPSFYVFPERQSWRCFGACATGGDVFSFFMREENLDFGEALRRLARQAGVELAEKREQKGRDDVLFGINEAAREYFCDLLASNGRGSSARSYLRKRGLAEDTVQRFQLGLSPGDGESLKRYLTSTKGYAEDQLALAGLVTRGQDTGYRDLFRRRIIFPIRDAEGRLAGFGGRALDDSNPKYLNSPRSPIFDKGHILYALYLAKDTIQRNGIVIVEGYMDAIVAHQGGFANVVASLGTALTQQQVALVRGLVRTTGSSEAQDVILALDPDEAGREATLRSIESSWEVFQKLPASRGQGTALYERQKAPSIKVASLPQGKDPDEIILDSPGEWAAMVGNAVPLMDYLFAALSSRLDLNGPQGKAKLAELLFPLIAATPDPFQQDHYFQRLAGQLGVTEVALEASLARARLAGPHYWNRSTKAAQGQRSRSGQGGVRGQEASPTPFARLEHDQLEEHCLALLLQYPHLLRHLQPWQSADGSEADSVPMPSSDGPDSADGLRLEYFEQVANREIFTNLLGCPTLDFLRETLDDEIRGHLERLVAKELPPGERGQREADLRYCVRRLEERYLRGLNQEEETRLSQAAAEDREDQERRVIQVNERLSQVLKG